MDFAPKEMFTAQKLEWAKINPKAKKVSFNFQWIYFYAVYTNI